jgi:hypothetical protein
MFWNRVYLAGPLLCLAATTGSATLAAERSVVIYDGATHEVAAGPDKSSDLWLTPADLKQATKFELKPQGMCTETLCIPLPEARKDAFVATQAGETRFNLSEFARLLKQPIAHDADHAVWCFGPRPEAQNSFVQTLMAPDFTLPDLQGKNHSLAEFRGKKVLLLTWGSW